jgi:preprotein translocase subunit YajC
LALWIAISAQPLLPPPLLGVPQGGGGGFVFFIQLIAIIAIFYFLLIRPQRKEQQRHRAMVAALKKGDRVVTAGGIVGKVIHAQEQHLTIVTAENTRLVIERSKIATLTNPRDS